jgi:hypothetical protein
MADRDMSSMQYFHPLFKAVGVGLTVLFATLGLVMVAVILWF